jgi:hypothetical protein
MNSTPRPDRRRDLALILFSSLGLAAFVFWGSYLIVQAVLTHVTTSNMLDAASKLFCGLLLLPMLLASLRHWRGQELRPANVRPIRLAANLLPLLAAWVAALVLAGTLPNLLSWGWLPALPFFFLGLILPAAGLAWIAVGGLPGGSWRRVWSVLGVGMTGSTLLAVAAEYLLIGVGAVGLGVAAVLDPAFKDLLTQLRSQVTGSTDVQAVLTNLAPFLTKPWVIVLVTLGVAVFVPLIEETTKSLGVWLVGKRLHSPAEGFALGAMCGAGFAILEGFNAATNNSVLLGVGLLARATSTLMHISASAILGWGVASAVLQKRYGRLALAALTSMSIHGLWNGSVVLVVFGALKIGLSATQPGITSLGAGLLSLAGLGVLLLLFASMLALLPIANHRLRPRPAAAPLPPSEPPLTAGRDDTPKGDTIPEGDAIPKGDDIPRAG